MTLNACPSGQCNPNNQTVYLTQSADGINWSLVPGFPATSGSVPTPIRRGNTLYVYFIRAMGPILYVLKYHYDTGLWDNLIQVSLSDPQGYGAAVDPSAILDGQGNIVLFYTSTLPNVNYDPATCPPGQTTCVQHFRMATEVAGSDGASFVAAANDVVSLPLGGPGQPDHSGDPAVFFDGAQYVLYLPSAVTVGSFSQIISLYTSPNLGGPYTLSSTVPNGVLAPSPGGIGSGYFHASLQHYYWTYVHFPEQVNTIHRAVKGSLSQQIMLSDWTVVASGSSLGLGANISVQHPHIVTNGNPLIPQSATHDFNGNSISDILLRNTGSGIAMWLMNSSAAIQSAVGTGATTSDWIIVGQRDLNGDGKSDILFRNTNGSIAEWLMNGATITSAVGLGNPTTNWNIVGTGDFNGDGIGDILFRGAGTAVAIWYMNSSGTLGSAVGVGSLPNDWSVAGTGDFDGDGMSDILWYNTTSGGVATWLMNANGTVKSAVGLGSLPVGVWSVVGTGDFDGDGISDILFLGGGTAVAIWFVNSSGMVSSAQGVGSMAPGWTIAETGDFNGDGRSDILWYNATSGGIAAWLMNGATVVSAVSIGSLPPASWSIVTANSD